jgi:hypothetical protein
MAPRRMARAVSKRLERAIACARSWTGMSAVNEESRLYAAVVLPNDNEEAAERADDTFSSCALTALGYYRELGIQDSRLDRPYIGRNDAVTQVVSIARAAGAWVTPTPNSPLGEPNVGDVVLIGSTSDPSYGGTEHVFVIVAFEPEEGHYVCVEGGRGPHGAAIDESRRVFLWRGDALWAVRAAQPLTAARNPNGRRCVGFLSVALLLAKLEPDDTDLAALV